MRPAHTVFQLNDIVPSLGPQPSTLADLPYFKHVSSGRAALFNVLDICGIGPGAEVLLPAYHCIAMVEPILARGAQPAFFSLNHDLSPDIKSIQMAISDRTRAIVVAHYFGFLNDFSALGRLSRAHDLVVIEDCAHAYFGSIGGAPVGSQGDFAIGSTRKFFGMFDGGIVGSNRNNAILGIQLRGPSIGFELKAAINILERAAAAGKLGFVRPLIRYTMQWKDSAWRKYKTRAAPAGVSSMGAAEGSYSFEADWAHRRPSLASWMVWKASSDKRIVEARRRNYGHFLRLFATASPAKCILPELPDDVAPYLFPLYVPDLDRAMPALHKVGIPFQRFGDELWPGMDLQTCPVTRDYSRNVIQFPVHQGLSSNDIDWIAAQVLSIIGLSQSGAPI